MLLKTVIGNSDVLFFLIIAAFQILCICFIYRKYSVNLWFSLFLFIASGDYISWVFNGMRQFIAVTLIFACLPLLIVEGIHFLESDIIGSTGEDLMYNVAVFSRITSAVYLPNTYSHYRKSNVTSITHSYKKNLVQKWKKQYELIREQLEQENQREIFFEALSNRIALGLIGLGMSLVNDTTLTMEEKKKELNRVLNMQQYKSAFEKLDLSYFSVQWKIFFLLAKQRNSCMVYQLLAIMNRMRGH